MNMKCQPFGKGKEASMAAFRLEKSQIVVLTVGGGKKTKLLLTFGNFTVKFAEDMLSMLSMLSILNNDKLHQINMSTVIYVCMYVIYDSW